MKINERNITVIEKILISIIVILTLFPIGYSFYNILILLPCSILLLFYSNYEPKKILLALFLIALLIIISISNMDMEMKNIILFVFIFQSVSRLTNIQTFFSKILIFALYFLFFTAIIQRLFPNPIWFGLAENPNHLHMLKVGYSSYSTVGNSTHAAYITLLIGTYLLYIAKKGMFYFFLTIISLVLFANKMSMLIFTSLYFLNYLVISKPSKKLIAIVLFSIISFALWFFVFEKYYLSWTSTDVSNIHTINHRTNLFQSLLTEASNISFWLKGNPKYIENFALPFDSGLMLLSFRYGIIFTVLLYLFFFLRIGLVNIYMFLTIITPSLTQVSFYNSQFLIFIAIIISSTYKDYPNTSSKPSNIKLLANKND
ncbi:hypothetical protein [Providencia sp. T47]|nr:hypothetical protein [Providencia rettgeri]